MSFKLGEVAMTKSINLDFEPVTPDWIEEAQEFAHKSSNILCSIYDDDDDDDEE